jgi:hypothetical protein
MRKGAKNWQRETISEKENRVKGVNGKHYGKSQ